MYTLNFIAVSEFKRAKVGQFQASVKLQVPVFYLSPLKKGDLSVLNFWSCISLK